MGILVEMIYPLCVEKRASSFDPVHRVSFSQQEFCEVSAVLPRNTGDKCNFTHYVDIQLFKDPFTEMTITLHRSGKPFTALQITKTALIKVPIPRK
jgi:hypothetical protein